jgi:magnesium transporter
MGVIHARLFRAGQAPVELDNDALELGRVAEGELVWLDLEAPSDQELQDVVGPFGIDAHALEIVRRTNRRPLVRVFREHFLVAAFSVEVGEEQSGPRTSVVEIDVVVGRTFLITVHKPRRPPPFFHELESRTATNPYLSGLPSTYLLYILLDTIVGQYAREFDEVEDRVERLEEQLLRQPGRAALDEATVMKRHVLNLRRLVAPHREAFGVLAAADIPLIRNAEVEVYFRDLLDHLDEFIDRLDHARDVLTGAFNLYLSNISHRSNQELRVLTFLSAVLLPMTVITGLFGTNFALTEYQSWEPFYLMLAGMGALAAGMLAYMRWRHWL